MGQTGAMGSRPAVAAAAAAGALVVGHALPSVAVLGTFVPRGPTSVGIGGSSWRWRWPGPDAGGALALTFDDGPDPASTPRTLDVLDELSLRATFFVVGSAVERHPAIVADIVGRGHGIGVHGHHHRHHLLRTPAWVCSDTAVAVASVGSVTGGKPRWYRPPFGQLSTATVLAAGRHGLQVVLWSRWGREFSSTSADPVVRRLLPGVVPGAVLLLHDSDRYARPGTAAITRQVLTPLAAAMRERRLSSVTLDELARLGSLARLSSSEAA